MKTLSLCSIALLALISYNGKAQTCHGNHAENMKEITSQNGVIISYRINHCNSGDEVLIQISNTNTLPVSVSFAEKVFSANQVWESPVIQNFQIGAQSVITSSGPCSAQSSSLQLVGAALFPNEYHPEDNYFPELLDFQIFNINIQ